MFSVTYLVRGGYVLGLFVALFLLLRPNLSHGQFRGNMMPAPHRPRHHFLLPLGMMGLGGAMMGMMGQGGGMMGMGGGGMMGMGGMGGGMMGQGGGMMGQGGGMMGMGGGMGGMMGQGGGMMGQGGGISPLQLQLLAEFGAVPVNGMMGFAGKNLGGFNGGNGL